MRTFILSACVAVAFASAAPMTMVKARADEPSVVTLSILGTSDLHGAALPRNGFGGLALLAGYVNNLRHARDADGGAVLLVDSGDTFQGDIESSISEGAFVVDACNAMGYAAEAIGNHDFDFGAVDSAAARQTAGDLRGAIKARAAQAHFPFLAANLIDASTGMPVDWPNVHPSVLVNAAGIKLGIIGVITSDALRSTIAANVQGLRIAPIEATIVAEASRLRTAGADVILVASHAGGRCTQFEDPADLSSCDADSEIFRVARQLPRGLVDVIAAGHTHAGLAQEVNGIAIVEPLSHGQAFDRVDVDFDRAAHTIRRVRLFAPQPVDGGAYEGRPVVADPAVSRAMDAELQRVHRLQASTRGEALAAPVHRAGDWNSPLGNLFADAIRHAVPGADVAVLNGATRGLWADLPAGLLTFGHLYNAFPFDNRIARITLTGAELARWLRTEIQAGRRSGIGISGVSLRTSCNPDGLRVDLVRNGALIRDEDRLLVVTIGGPTLSGNVASADPLGGGPPENGPVVREVVEDWLEEGAETTRARVEDAVRERIAPPEAMTPGCPF